jgi:hypothetical protein
MEEAISQRKRSSRLAIKENEKEEARLASLRKVEEEEKLSRVRRLEARQKREEEERLKREAAREKRRLDREERERRAQAREEEEEERWVALFEFFCARRRLMHHSGRMRARRSTSSESTQHHNGSHPRKLPKASLDDQGRRLPRQLRVRRLRQVVRGHQWVKIGSWIARSVIDRESTRSMDVPNYGKAMVSLTLGNFRTMVLLCYAAASAPSGSTSLATTRQIAKRDVPSATGTRKSSFAAPARAASSRMAGK